MDKKVLDVNYIELNNSTHNNYYSIDDISEMLNIEEFKIIFWCNKFNDILKIQSIGQYQIFDDNDLRNLKIIKELNIDKGLDIKAIKDYLKEHNNVIITRQQNLSEVSIVSVLAKIINSQNRKINTITNSHNKILKTNQRIIENQEKFIQMLSNYHQELSLDKLNQKEMLVAIKENQLKETENIGVLNNKVNELSVDLKTDNEKLSSKVEQVKTHIDKSSETTNQLQQDNKKMLEELTVSIAEMKENEKKLAELLDNTESKEDAFKKAKNDSNKFLNKLAKKMFGK